ncbi:MAG TPA: DNA mismatch repair protein MutS [Xanthobacteraceae bacterium]|nr:DNA mismatch repair protein MutS [Xanthobacteraceae bacterium]
MEEAALREAARNGRRNQTRTCDPQRGLPWNAETLTADLALRTLFETMAQDDDCVFEVSRRVVLGGVSGDIDTIRYRQAVLQDCLAHPAVIRELYTVAVEATAEQQRHYLGSFFARYPDAVLRHGIDLLSAMLGLLRKLRRIADAQAGNFTSEGATKFFAMLQRDLDDEYLMRVQRDLDELKLREGVLLSAALGKGNRGANYVLRRFPQRPMNWWRRLADALDRLVLRCRERIEVCPARLRPQASPVYSFALHPRDEAGARALAELRNRGIALVADALAQSADHVRDFFGMLQAELAFYVGCLNLREALGRKGEPICMPVPAPADEQRLAVRGLYDVCLTIKLDRRAVGNDMAGDGKRLVVVTGANTGGKSTFLRSLGLAQLMMQAGMFVGAEEFRASLASGVFTHYKREEDAGMKSGKLDEELSRMSEIVDHLRPGGLLLLNESFAATNEREGSEVARQIMTALLDKQIRIVCVTHLYELSRGFLERDADGTLFLRAERDRTFKLLEGDPLPTSYGEDLYRDIFGDRLSRQVDLPAAAQ